MLMTAVVLPEALRAAQFSMPGYHLNAEVFLRGIDSNGLILVDADEHLYRELCDAVESLAAIGKGKNTHALFEELLKKRRQKIVRFARTTCRDNHHTSTTQVASTVASSCRPDAIVTGPTSELSAMYVPEPGTALLSLLDYISSDFEKKRRECYEGIPPIDQMESNKFGDMIVRSTRYSRWLRFYDKQIGKGTNLSHFRRGIERILRLWIDNCHFPVHELSVDLFTCVDDARSPELSTETAYRRVRDDLVMPLRDGYSLSLKFHMKTGDVRRICHARHLQTQSMAILFDRGFDFLNGDGSFRRSIVKIDGTCCDHLREYRELPEFVLSS